MSFNLLIKSKLYY